MSFFSRAWLSCILLIIAPTTWAIELADGLIPASIKDSYKTRQLEPLSCIKNVTVFMDKVAALPPLTDYLDGNRPPIANKRIPNNAPTHLLASCYIALEDYEKSLSLLLPLLKNPSETPDQMRTLNLIASEIPESERPQLSNETLINMMQNSLQVLKQNKNMRKSNLVDILNLSVTKLALETHQYQLANQSLSEVKKHLKNSEESELVAWLAYFYGHYYDQINQQQLAIANFQTANAMADKLQLTSLSSLVKESLSHLYQQKHRYTRAIDFASQRVELLLPTENYVQQADSLIKFAILKRQNKEFNQALIYLFNALELVEKKHKTLLAYTYLELGRTYASIPYDQEKNTDLAQKYLQNARHHFQMLQKLEQQTESTLLLAQLNIRSQDTGLAILQLENVLTLAKDKFPELRVKAFEMLALSYELSGDHQQANFHFKNFHSLQNAIKEKLFALQQLKINEQFQLIEQTQQQIQLETQNNQLLLKNNRFRDIAYVALILLLLSLLVTFLFFRRNKKLAFTEQIIRKRLQFHPRTELPSHQVQVQNYELQYQGRPLFYALVHIPFLSNLNGDKGLFNSEKIETALGEELRIHFSQHTQVRQVRDNQLLFICEQEHHGTAKKFAQEIELFFKHFAENYALNGQIATGVVAFPFLHNVSRAIAPERMLNLTSLALFGACQICDKVNESSWLELYAIEKIQPAFFDGDLWLLGQAGIDKGIVKLKCSHPSTTIDWPELNR
jgi:hypothetical protein